MDIYARTLLGVLIPPKELLVEPAIPTASPV